MSTNTNPNSNNSAVTVSEVSNSGQQISPPKRQVKQYPIKSIQRIGSLPVIESVTAIYGKFKGSNFLVRWGLKPAEMGVWLAVGSTKPFIALFPTPVYAVDYMVCASLDVIEKNLPVVTYPPDLVFNITKDYVTNTFVSPVLKRADSVKQISLTVANKGGELASTRLNNAIDVAEKYMDIYLPDTSETTEDGDGKTAKTLNHMNRFGRKLQRRLTRRTIAEAQALKQQGLDTIHCIIYLADLLAKDPKTFMEKTKIMWAQLSEDEPENQIPPANLEQLINMFIREMARRVVHLINYLTAKTVFCSNYAIHFAHIAFLNIVYWADYLMKTLHLQFIPDAIRAKYNYYASLLDRMLTFVRQLNTESGRPAVNQVGRSTHAQPNLQVQYLMATSHTPSVRTGKMSPTSEVSDQKSSEEVTPTSEPQEY